jgi:hypothetical protein
LESKGMVRCAGIRTLILPMKWSARQIIVGILIGLALFGIVSFIVWRLRLANDINRQIAAIHAAGLPATGTELDDYYAAVPDDENAAVKMAEAFELMTNFSDRRSNEVSSIKFPQRKDILAQEQLELLAEYCAMNSNSLVQAGEAIKMSRSRYDMDLSWGNYTLLPHLAKLKALSRIAAFQSLLDTNDSFTAISTIIGMARTLDAEPLLISKLVRVAMLSISVSALEKRLNQGDLNDMELSHLTASFADSAKTNQMANGLVGERAMNVPYFRMGFAEIKRLADSGEDNSSQPAGPPLPGSQPFILKLTGFFERDLRFYLQAMETNISSAVTFPKNISLITNVQNHMVQTVKHNYYILSMLLLPALDRAIFKEAGGLAQVYTAQTALAVERFRLAYGKLPINLNELVPQFLSAVPTDPFDPANAGLRYHHLAKGYVIYSIGRDGHDNGGRERPSDAKSSDQTEYDITFTVER